MGTPYRTIPRVGRSMACRPVCPRWNTVANHPTTQVFAHGAVRIQWRLLAFAFAQEDIDLTGVVMDSKIVTPRASP